MQKNLLLHIFFILGACSSMIFGKTKTFELTINNQTHSLEATDGACAYHWYKNGEEVVGENDHSIVVTESGTYTVVAENLAGEVYQEQAELSVTATGAIIKIYTIGDSTVQDYTAGYYPRKGWGQVLPYFFNTANVQVVNKGAGGTSSKSFYNNHWAAVRNALVAGDFVFIQFGINDRNSADTARYAPTGGVFESYLTKFVNETKAKGAFPVLVATLRRNSWNADGKTVYDAYHDHPVAVRTVAKNLGVPLIDLDAKAKVLMESVGKTYSTRFFYNNYVAGEYTNYPSGNTDDVHFQEMGAIEMAKLVTQGVSELSADANVSKLIPFINPQYQIAVSVNPTGVDSATTRTTTYPQGLTITLKTLPKSKSTFQKWNNASGTQIATSVMTTFVMGTAATSYTAMYKGATLCTATATAGGATTFCQGSNVVLTASTGSSYQWFKDGANITTGGASKTYTATSSGSYTVKITDASNCSATSTAIVVTVTTPTTWYADTDADGKGDPNTKQTACTQPTGYVADNTDQCPTDVNKIAPGVCGCGKTEQSCVDCNNVVNGTATLDNCDRCTGGTTGKTACTASGEAETDACAYEGVTEAINAGFKGASYLNGTNVLGATITFQVNASTAGTKILSFRYANGGANDRAATVSVNGTNLANNLSFPTTGAFTTWKTVDLQVTLIQGNNTIKLTSTLAEGLANIDQIGYVSAGLTKGSCVVTEVVDLSHHREVSIYPNPSNHAFTLDMSQNMDVELINHEGKQVFKHKDIKYLHFGEELSKGVYLLKLINDQKTETYKIVKE